jgi:hypothetical protein
VLGFSLGSQVISAYLAQHTPPPGVRFVLLGDTFARNDQFVAAGQGIPADVANKVILVARQYDGWSDSPTTASPDYVNARLDDPANVVTTRGNITSVLIPTQHLPLNNGLDAQQRPLIDSAYDRPGPTPDQLAASTGEQVGNH